MVYHSKFTDEEKEALIEINGVDSFNEPCKNYNPREVD